MDIFKIVRKNDLQMFKNAIEENPELIHSRDSIYNTPLSKAIFWKCNNIAKYLIDENLQLKVIDKDCYNIYEKAVLSENIEILQYIFDNNKVSTDDTDLYHALVKAMRLDNYDIFKCIYTYCDVNPIHPFYSNMINLTGMTTGRIKSLIIQHKIKIKEPIKLYPRDDLTDPYTLEDITTGTEYAVRMDDKQNYYCMGTKKTIETMLETKFKTSDPDMVFDLIANKPVPLHSVMYCIKLECPDVVKKIYNNTFTKEDYIDNFIDVNYDMDLYGFATRFDSLKALEVFKEIASY
jgi:hypothetical protein